MKGVILAGGTGSRLHPLTKITNKHLLPVYDRPMIQYPIEMMAEAGIDSIMVVSGGNHIGDIFETIGDGSEFGVRLDYAVQPRPDGIAGALSLARWFVGSEPFVVCLGDNIFGDSISDAVENWDGQKAKVFVKVVNHPEEYGILVLDSTNMRIVEKPTEDVGNMAVTGLYMYPPDVFDFIEGLEPSDRDELEITDVNNMYLEQGRLEYEMVLGLWLDAGESIDALLESSIAVKAEREREGKD
jgi:glucose-1-phosphate thymidylyltransferase